MTTGDEATDKSNIDRQRAINAATIQFIETLIGLIDDEKKPAALAAGKEWLRAVVDATDDLSTLHRIVEVLKGGRIH
jgi:hypothetical protein